jgi:Uma2 family endonuclease
VSTQRNPRFTPEEYLSLERAAEYKSEYVDGEIVAMSGASERHVSIVTNLVLALGSRLKGGPCKVYSTDLRLRVGPSRMYTYPDLIVVCGERRFADDQRDTLLNPTLLVEVLSPSTEGYDLGKKFEYYRLVDSLAEYVTVAQDRAHVEHHVRQPDNRWLLEEAGRLDETLHLPSIGCDLPLSEVYDGIDLSLEE